MARAANSSASQPAPTPRTTVRRRAVEAGDLLGEHDGLALGQHEHRRAQLDAPVTAAAIARATIESNHGSSVAHVATPSVA